MSLKFSLYEVLARLALKSKLINREIKLFNNHNRFNLLAIFVH
jgi:hypothetical protein